SAAIAGLDGVKGAKVGAIDSVTMETRKPPRGLAGAPWIESQQIDLDSITRETLIFEGTATEACRAFLANVNVVAALSLAGIGPEKTRIRIFASPEQPLNRHRITGQGEFGRLTIEIENVPSENPRTGKLSYLSTIAFLRDLSATLPVRTWAALGAARRLGLVPVQHLRHRAALVRMLVLRDSVGVAALVVFGQVFGDRQSVRPDEQQAVAVLVLLHLVAGADPAALLGLGCRVWIEVARAERLADLLDMPGEPGHHGLGYGPVGVERRARLLGILPRVRPHLVHVGRRGFLHAVSSTTARRAPRRSPSG